MIDTIAVDLGGLAARFLPGRRLAALASLGGVSEQVIEERIFASGVEGRSEVGAYSIEEFLRVLGNAVDCQDSEALTGAWALAFEPDLEMLESISCLRGRKILFTNNGPMLDACFAGPLRMLPDQFHQVVCSWHLKARKPDAVAFERAAARLRTVPDQLLLLDDSPDNVDAALRCGWDAECVTDLNSLIAAVEKRPFLRAD